MAESDSIVPKTCIRCEVVRTTADFYPYKRSRDKLFYECKTCQKERAVAWQKANPEKKKASDRKQDQKPERKAAHNERTRKAYKADPSKTAARTAAWAKANPERAAARVAKHRAAKPESVAAAQKRYHDSDEYKWVHRLRSQVQRAVKKAREMGIQDGADCITRTQWATILERFEHCCCYCNTKTDLSIEHLTPLIRGGDNSVGNIAPACNPCNRKKWKRTAEEFDPEKANEIRRKAKL